MALSTTNINVEHVGDGTTTVFSFDFQVYEERFLYTTVDEILTAVTYSLNPDQQTSPGGTATFATPPANGAAIVITRFLPYVQETIYNDFSPFPAKVTEFQMDEIVMQIQQLAYLIGTGGPGGDFPEAPTDGRIYGRQGSTASWQVVPEEAPSDGQQYARQDEGWVVVSGGGGLPDPPILEVDAIKWKHQTDFATFGHMNALYNTISGGAFGDVEFLAFAPEDEGVAGSHGYRFYTYLEGDTDDPYNIDIVGPQVFVPAQNDLATPDEFTPGPTALTTRDFVEKLAKHTIVNWEHVTDPATFGLARADYDTISGGPFGDTQTLLFEFQNGAAGGNHGYRFDTWLDGLSGYSINISGPQVFVPAQSAPGAGDEFEPGPNALITRQWANDNIAGLILTDYVSDTTSDLEADYVAGWNEYANRLGITKSSNEIITWIWRGDGTGTSYRYVGSETGPTWAATIADFVSLGSGGLPPGALNNVLRHDGSTWIAAVGVTLDATGVLLAEAVGSNSTMSITDLGTSTGDSEPILAKAGAGGFGVVTDSGVTIADVKAPEDGEIYGRQDGAWVVVPSGGGGLPTPSTNAVLRGDNATDWVVATGVTLDNTGVFLAQALGSSSTVSITTLGTSLGDTEPMLAKAGGAGFGVVTDSGLTIGDVKAKLNDAPSDGNQYARQDGAWTVVSTGGGGIPEAPNDGVMYGRRNETWQAAVSIAQIETITGAKTFANGIEVQQGTNPAGAAAFTGLVGINGELGMFDNKITDVADPTAATDAANRQWVLAQIPDTSGFVTIATDQTITGAKTFTAATEFSAGLTGLSAVFTGHAGTTAGTDPVTTQYTTVNYNDANYAPISHTHTSSQITDFNTAVDARVNAIVAGYLPLSGGTMSGNIDFGGGPSSVIGLPAPTAGGIAASKSYVDGRTPAPVPVPGGNGAMLIGSSGSWVVSSDLTMIDTVGLTINSGLTVGNVVSGAIAATGAITATGDITAFLGTVAAEEAQLPADPNEAVVFENKSTLELFIEQKIREALDAIDLTP